MRSFILSVLCLCFACSSVPAAQKTDTKKSALYESDDSNCGALGYACVDGRTCSDSVCTPAWIEMEDDGAPAARGAASGGFIDGKFVVYGGCDSLSGTPAALDSGASYDPSNDTWGSVPSMPHARSYFALNSTDSGLYAFAGTSVCWDGSAGQGNLDVLFDSSGSWSSILSSGEPSARYNIPSMVWTGSSLMVFGGSDSMNPAIGSSAVISLGSSWEDTSCPLPGCERGGQFAGFYDRGLVHFWGGAAFGSAPGGLLYDIDHKSWYDWTVPSGTPDFSSEWEAQVKFGDDGRRIYYLASGTVYIYDRKSESWSSDTSSMPSGMSPDAATAWTGTELIAWGGKLGASLSAVGGRYQPPAPLD